MSSILRNKFLNLSIFILFLAILSVFSCTGANYEIKKHYTKSEHMVLMRDGVKLYTQVYVPKDKNQKYPVMLFRTPYSVGDYGPEIGRRTLVPNKMYAPEEN